MKKNLFTILLYCLLIVFLVFILILLEQPFLLPILLPFVIAPFITTFLYKSALRQISFHAYCRTAAVELGNPLIFVIEADNKSRIPLYLCNIIFRIENLFLPNPVKQTLSIPLSARKTGLFEIPVEATVPGMISFQVSEIQVSDFFRFFTASLPYTFLLQAPVLPPKAEIEMPDMTVSSEGEEEVISNTTRGMPSSDIKEIREYRPGDRIQRIHWKLSAKLDDLFVKELSNTSVLSLVILPELTENRLSETASLLRTVMEYLLAQEQPFELCLYNHLSCSFDFILVSSKDEFLDCFIKFYFLPFYKEENLALTAFQASSQHGASLIQLSGTDINRIELINN